ncbi:ABC transporter ATPase [Flavobacterium columnare]|uniref:ABC transporter ATPase n=1 Tax=Flavobacterium columnare TaxID=996 RepID=A0A437UA51_9FLAO|nr:MULTISPECIES: ABC transporter ATPase [Flavobacterium]QYS89290.1 ABC transporter ATPase [Flavobacterium davisii]RVU90489.1 ABC transporter ATPase [Flavobacterium columnare]
MYIPFENMPLDSRVWIYQSNRKLSDDEIKEIAIHTEKFLADWSAHGTPLEASFDIRYNRFIILTVNPSIQAPTGCSIDSSVQFIQQLEQKYAIDLLDKMNVTFKNGEFIAHKSLIDFKKMAKEKAVSASTIVFNNLVNTIEELNDSWEVPASESWHSRFF